MLTNEEFRLFSSLIYEESGICLKESRKDFLENRLAKRMAASGMTSPYWYYRLVAEKRKTELLVLLDMLTINETSFFRNKPQMDLFREVILPELAKKKGTSAGGEEKRLRLWSAGCSTGEEPYSIAMTICEAVGSPALWDFKVFASDLSLTALEAAQRAEYDPEKVHATVSDLYIARYFEKKGGVYQVKDEIRKMVVFDFHNLKSDNGLAGLDAIFCRNVMIYFDEEEQKRLARKLSASLNPGGYLLLGHTESLQGWGTGLEFVYAYRGTAYRKPENPPKNPEVSRH